MVDPEPSTPAPPGESTPPPAEPPAPAASNAAATATDPKIQADVLQLTDEQKVAQAALEDPSSSAAVHPFIAELEARFGDKGPDWSGLAFLQWIDREVAGLKQRILDLERKH